MSREQYQVPTTGTQIAIGGAGGATTSDNQNASYGQGGVMHYTCGDCASRCPLEKGAPIRCFVCGGRVLYKERTKRMVQFEAR